MHAQLSHVFSNIELVILAALAVIYCLRLLLLSVASVSVRSARHPVSDSSQTHWPPICVVITAYNEEKVIEAAVRSVLAADYPSLEIIVVDDGSADSTYPITARLAKEDPRIIAIRQPHNMGRAEALNCGCLRATAEFLVFIDADTIASPGFLKCMVAPLAQGCADAVSGNVTAGNRTRPIQIFQSIEYIATLNATRLIQNRSNAVTTIPGAAAAMRKSALQAVGAYSGGTLTEDADVTLRLGGQGFRIFYERCATVQTEVPSTWRALFFQRRRWIHGNILCIVQHLTSPGFRRSALMFGMPEFMYENIVKPPLEFARACIPLLVIGHLVEPWLLEGYLLLMLVNWVIAVQAYRTAGEPLRETVWAPLKYLIWPLFLIFPYSAAVWHCVRGRDISWKKDGRLGELAAQALRSSVLRQ